MRSLLFVVHGMGRHEESVWADPWKRRIYENLRRYAPYEGRSDDELAKDVLEIRPVSYDQVFEDQFRERWSDLEGALADRSSLCRLADVLDWLEGAGDPDGIFWSHVLDALLWFTNPQARKATIASVASQLAQGLDEFKAQTGQLEASILAHSLGTSVTHDTLQSLSDSVLTANAFQGRNYKWRTLVQVANVSRLLQNWMPISTTIAVERYKAHRSLVRPGGRGALVKTFINLTHRIDPFTWPREFDPQWDLSTFKNVQLKRYDALQKVHDLETYLDHPGAHLRIFQGVLGDRTLGRVEEQERAWSAYDQLYGRVAGNELAGLRALLQGQPDRKLGPVELAKYLVAVWKELKS